MPNPHNVQVANLMNDGRVLVCGGYSAGFGTQLCELYNPASGWSAAPSLPSYHGTLTGVLLPSGKVLVAGNGNSDLFDPSTNTFKVTSAPMAAVRTDFAATLLQTAGKIDQPWMAEALAKLNRDPLLAGLLRDLVLGETLDAEGLTLDPALPDHDHRQPFGDRRCALESERDPRDAHDEDGQSGGGEQRRRQRRVLLGHTLLDEVAHDDQQDELERGHPGELFLAHRAADDPQEQVDDGGANDRFHYGATQVR